jgi:hypothetical protein
MRQKWAQRPLPARVNLIDRYEVRTRKMLEIHSIGAQKATIRS